MPIASQSSRRRARIVAASRRSALPVLLLGAGLGACSGSPKPPTTTNTTTVSSTASTNGMAAMTPEDRTPVDAPEGLAVQLHVAAPKVIMRAVKNYFPSFASKLDARQLAGEILDAPVLAQLIDIDQPVDAALLLQEGKGVDGLHVAFAFGLEEGPDPVGRLRGAFKAEPRAGGVIRLVPTRPGKWDDPDLGNFHGDCWITPSIGAAKHRLVCSPQDIESGDVALLAPWLSRGVTRREAEATTAKLEVDVASLRKRFDYDLQHAHDEIASESGRWMSIGRAETDKVIARLTKSLVDEVFDFIGDLDAVTLEGTLLPEGAKVAMRSTFGRSSSWTAKASLAHADGIGKPPKALGAMPSEGAWYAAFANASPGSDALVQPIQNAMLQLAEATAIDDAWSTKDKNAALELVRLLFPRAADAIAVGGESKDPLASEETKVDAGDYSKSSTASLTRLGKRRTWSLGMVQRDAKPSIELAKSLAALVTKPAFAATLKKLTRDRFSMKIAVKPLTDKKLPKGAFAQTYDCSVSMRESYYGPVAVEVPKSPAGKPTPKPKAEPAPKEKMLAQFRIDEIIAEDAGRTFVAWSTNEGPTPLITRLDEAIKGTSKLTWSQRDGFAAFADTSAAGGAIIAVDGFSRLMSSDPTKSTWLSELPDGGRGTFSVSSTATKSGPGGTSTTTSFLSRDALQGVLELAKVLDHFF